jgi:hypothetical protein
MANTPKTLRSGTSPVRAGATPVKVTAQCITQADGMTTRLTLSVNGTTVADFTDKSAEVLDEEGWVACVDAIIAPPQSTVTISSFDEGIPATV